MKRLAVHVLLPAVAITIAAVIVGLVQNSVSAQPLRLTPSGLAEIVAFDEAVDVERAVRTGAVLIDSREAGDYAAGHIRGALSVPFADRRAQLDALIRRVPSTTQVIVYCDEGCASAPRLAEWLRAQGWQRVGVFPGGIRLWQQTGLPVTTDSAL
jgi:rhodanese-related sulfurtransferase